MMDRKRRNSMEIVIDILETCKGGATKTAIVYETNINFILAKRYIDYLMNAGFLQVVKQQNSLYLTTEKGTEVVENYIRLGRLLQEGQIEEAPYAS